SRTLRGGGNQDSGAARDSASARLRPRVRQWTDGETRKAVARETPPATGLDSKNNHRASNNSAPSEEASGIRITNDRRRHHSRAPFWPADARLLCRSSLPRDWQISFARFPGQHRRL